MTLTFIGMIALAVAAVLIVYRITEKPILFKYVQDPVPQPELGEPGVVELTEQEKEDIAAITDVIKTLNEAWGGMTSSGIN